jgi:hypothetical protein
MVKEQIKGVAKGDETGGIGDSHGGSGYDTKATVAGLGVDVDWGDSENLGEPTPTTTAPTGATGSNHGVSGATTMGMRAPSPTIGGLMGGVGSSGPPASRTRSATRAATTSYVSGVGIGGNLTSSMAATGRAMVIEHNIRLCGLPNIQQWWNTLIFKDIHMVRSDDFTIKAHPLKTHLCMLKCFVLYFKRCNHSYYGTCTEDDVLSFTKCVFDSYCQSDDMMKTMQWQGPRKQLV